MHVDVHAQMHMPGFENLILNAQEVSEWCVRLKEIASAQLKNLKDGELRRAYHWAFVGVKEVIW